MEAVGYMDMVIGIEYLLIVILSVYIDPVFAKIPELAECHHLAVELRNGLAAGEYLAGNDHILAVLWCLLSV